MDYRNKHLERIGEENLNNQGCLMRIVDYKDANNIIVEFQDKYKTKIRSQYAKFLKGLIKNPYHPSVYGVGIIGNKYPVGENWKDTKEYKAWNHILERCYCKKLKENRPTYEDVSCCDEWLLFENFYEWLHSQENFDKWYNENRWAIDKDILVKGNKIYSPETCCLVSSKINGLFLKRERDRGEYPIGVCWHKLGFMAQCINPFTNKHEHIGYYSTPEKAFLAYKIVKENYIKKIAQEEYDKGNIIKKCYDAMMKYEVEITD